KRQLVEKLQVPLGYFNIPQRCVMKCEQIMKADVECVSPTDPAQAAATRMRDAEIGFLPVCDDDQRVIGTVTDRDLCVRLLADGRSPMTRVREVMTGPPIVSCLPSAE